MDAESESISENITESSLIDQINSGPPTNHSIMPPICSLCRMTPSTDSFSNANVGTVGICGHCKFLLLEDLDTATDFFSHEFSQMMNFARLSQPLVTEHHDHAGESEAISRSFQRISSRTTPDGSRRWRRMSDTESEGFDNMESLYGETESNVSYGARIFQGDSDTVSVSAYGGDSEVSMEDQSFIEMEMFPQSFERGGLESDSDIDPMHTGLVTWGDSDGHDDIEDEYGWEQADVEENAGELPNRRNRFLGLEQIVQLGILERGYNPIPRIISNPDEPSDVPQRWTQIGFEGLINRHISDNNNSRRGAPPAAESFVNNLPRILISENQQKSEEVGCAICKDPLSVGSEAIQLPCLHLYHPCCILPWLSRRNSCPLCRYELPTDDSNASSRNPMVIHEIQQEDDTSDDDDVSEQIETLTVEAPAEIPQELSKSTIDTTTSGRGRWCFLVAAPVVSVLGIVLVMWLGKSQKSQRVSQTMFVNPSQGSSRCRPENRQRQSRRWWHWF